MKDRVTIIISYVILALLLISIFSYFYPKQEEFYCQQSNTCIITKKYFFNIEISKSIKLENNSYLHYEKKISNNDKYDSYYFILNNGGENIQIFNQPFCTSKSNIDRCDRIAYYENMRFQNFLNRYSLEYKIKNDFNFPMQVWLIIFVFFIIFEIKKELFKCEYDSIKKSLS